MDCNLILASITLAFQGACQLEGIFSSIEELVLVDVVPTSINGSLILSGLRTGKSKIDKSTNSVLDC